ncbi:uncharacterized protein TNCV_392321 [Trichonephila clavipes]|nr:uncharacterized protein TNCV_392321 [Trichonephila clavipes]
MCYRLAADCLDEPRGYQQCLRNYCSANVAASGLPKLTPGSCTYADCCSSATKTKICTPVPQLEVQRLTMKATVAEWYRYRTVACLVMSSSPVPLKTRRVGQRCTLNLSKAETSSRWCSVVVRRGGASSGVVHVT